MLLTTSSPERVHSTILTRFTLLPSVCLELFPGEGQLIYLWRHTWVWVKSTKMPINAPVVRNEERSSKSLLDGKRIAKRFFSRKSYFSIILLDH
jgi:hypothetical protein